MNFVIYTYDMLFLFLLSLSLSVAQLYMLHIIDSCDDAGAQIIDGEEVLRQEYIYDKWPECQAQVYQFPVFERQPVVSLGSRKVIALLAYIIVQMDDDVVASNRDLYRYFPDDDERPLCVG